MSIVLTQRFLARDVFAVPFLTNHGIRFHYFSRVSVLHVPQKVPVSALKRFSKPQEVPIKPSKPSQSKPVPVHEKPVQAPCTTIKTVPPQFQEGALFADSVTMGGAPSPRHLPIPMFYVREKMKAYRLN
ncbi:unnamed protein product [Thlaspi arvense]|uniref:Uncharacterized protein n=1 Tax=Thlaspi arvense TaxID=13288 RepID=A0AAU9SAZ6_THLAR|nr:unnamed protein product [Thlaspi arvense]